MSARSNILVVVSVLISGCARITVGSVEPDGGRADTAGADTSPTWSDSPSTLDAGDGIFSDLDASDTRRRDVLVPLDTDLDITYTSDVPDGGFLGPDGALVCGHGDHICGGICVHDTSVTSCASACAPCPVPANGSATCDGFACGIACSAGFLHVGNMCVATDRTRLIAPLSTSRVTSRRPTLHWTLRSAADGARVELCRDRGCLMTIATLDVSGNAATPTSDLPAGVVFWRVRDRVAGVINSTPSETWQFTVPARSAPVDASWGSTLDVNGDGYADVIVNGGNPDITVGRINVFMGSGSGLAHTPAIVIDDPIGGFGKFGERIVSLGDVNGDGFGDVMVGRESPYFSPLYVFAGSSAGLSPLPMTVIRSPDPSHPDIGRDIVAVGDVNADGYADVVIGGTISSGKRLYMYLGSAGGLTTPLAGLSETPTHGSATESAAGIGDATGDGIPDMVVGGDTEAYLFAGSIAGFGPAPTAVLHVGGAATLLVGRVAAAGDVNGDGYTDVLVGGSNGDTAPWTALFFGSASGLSSASMLYSTTTLTGSGDPLGLGDVNGDGFDDIARPEYLSDASSRLVMYLGNGSGILATPQTFSLNGMMLSTTLISSGICSGDINGDGRADVAFVAQASAAGTQSVLITLAGFDAVPILRLMDVITGPASFGIFVAMLQMHNPQRGAA